MIGDLSIEEAVEKANGELDEIIDGDPLVEMQKKQYPEYAEWMKDFYKRLRKERPLKLFDMVKIDDELKDAIDSFNREYGDFDWDELIK